MLKTNALHALYSFPNILTWSSAQSGQMEHIFEGKCNVVRIGHLNCFGHKDCMSHNFQNGRAVPSRNICRYWLKKTYNVNTQLQQKIAYNQLLMPLSCHLFQVRPWPQHPSFLELGRAHSQEQYWKWDNEQRQFWSFPEVQSLPSSCEHSEPWLSAISTIFETQQHLHKIVKKFIRKSAQNLIRQKSHSFINLRVSFVLWKELQCPHDFGFGFTQMRLINKKFILEFELIAKAKLMWIGWSLCKK